VKRFEILMLPGDGIGQEISLEAEKILGWLDINTKLKLDITKSDVGGKSIDDHGEPLTHKVLNKALSADAILLGAVGGPKWEKLPFDIRPERGLLKLRKELDLYANYRPAIVFESLKDSSSLKGEIISGLDIMIIRELTSGIYFGEPRGIKNISENVKEGFNTLRYNTDEIKRIALIAFEVARKRKKKLCSVDKANVLESTELWREIVTETSEFFPDVSLSHMYVDNASMQLVKNPNQFDVIVTTNMFGDILSDCAAMLTGSLGMLPSASIGSINKITKNKYAMYEPVHGSAPDISGKNIANPLAMIQSVGMMLEYSFNLASFNKLILKSINKVLEKGFRTQDISNNSNHTVSTSDMGDLVIEELNKSKNEKI
tara:strand:+ start:180 stop:1298 length:1119 start_codon:yes stop_codon:yes gene_type:complete